MLQNLSGKSEAFISPVFLHFCPLTGSDEVNLALHKTVASHWISEYHGVWLHVRRVTWTILFNESSNILMIKCIAMCLMLLFFSIHRDMFTLNKSATRPKSATWKMGASGSLLMATIVWKTISSLITAAANRSGFRHEELLNKKWNKSHMDFIQRFLFLQLWLLVHITTVCITLASPHK